MTSDIHCYVYIMLPGETEFVTAARFQVLKNRVGEPVGEFFYGKQYLQRPNAVELDPVELKLSSNKFLTTKMHGYFGAIRDSMPDYWGRRVIERHFQKSELDEFDYLMHGPDDRAGALGFGLNVIPPAPKREFNKTFDLEKLQTLADAILNNKTIPVLDKHSNKHVEALLLEGTSMGGARPKVVVEDQNALWIAKFSTPQDRWNYPRIEHGFLNLAKSCGIHSAESKIVSIGNKDVLLVKRFDREYSDQGYFRFRMVSALTLLASEESIGSKNEWSYLLLADEIRRVSNDPKNDLKELFKRMCFNALVSNLDDHPRNHAILARKNNWSLSPAYDLLPSGSISLENRDLAMSCGLYGRSASKTNIMSAHHRFLLSEAEAQLIISDLEKIIASSWEKSLRRAGVSAKECEILSGSFLYPGFFREMA